MSVNTGVYLQDEDFAFAKNLVAEGKYSSLSALVTDLIRARREEKPIETTPFPLLALAARCAPALENRLNVQFAQRSVNQERIAANFLDALTRAMDSEGFNPHHPFVLTDFQKAAIEQAVGVLVERYGLRELAGVNEDAPSYEGGKAKSLKQEKPRPGALQSKPQVTAHREQKPA